MIATHHGYGQITDELLRAGADVNLSDHQGNNALINVSHVWTCSNARKISQEPVLDKAKTI